MEKLLDLSLTQHSASTKRSYRKPEAMVITGACFFFFPSLFNFLGISAGSEGAWFIEQVLGNRSGDLFLLARSSQPHAQGAVPPVSTLPSLGQPSFIGQLLLGSDGQGD